MGTRADFYVMDHDGSMNWIGSVFKGGDYTEIPFNILISGNKVLFEENVFDYIQNTDGVIRFGGRWPWIWSDSRMTDYSYIFHECTGQVYMSNLGKRLVDPIKLLKGMDVLGADNGMGFPKFPTMKKDIEERVKEIITLEDQKKIDEILSELVENTESILKEVEKNGDVV